MNKKNRLKKKLDFENVFKKGKAVNGSFLFIKYIKNKLSVSRFSFLISTKIARKAVERNKIRRILSEVARGIIDDLGDYDIIVLVNNKITHVAREVIKKDFLETLSKIK